MSQIPNLISYSECLLEKGIGYAGEAIGRWKIRNCKEKCANLAKNRGAPFWSWNSKNKRCHLKVTNSDPTAFGWMWSGNTDASCAYPTGCPSKSKEYRLTVHATDKKKGYLKDLIYRFKINVYLTFKKSFC